ncbi:hypothetical protein ACFLXA_02795 [Chloroflexota bacterium]
MEELLLELLKEGGEVRWDERIMWTLDDVWIVQKVEEDKVRAVLYYGGNLALAIRVLKGESKQKGGESA